MSGPRGVVVAVDDSDAARVALRWATEQARLRGAPLKAVHAFEPHHVAGMFGVAKLQPDAQWRADAQRWLNEFVRLEIGDVAAVESSRTSRPTDLPPQCSLPPMVQRSSSSVHAGAARPPRSSTAR